MITNKLELSIERDGNAVIGNYYRVSAWRGMQYLGNQIYAGYTRAESLRLARESVLERGGLGIWAN